MKLLIQSLVLLLMVPAAALAQGGGSSSTGPQTPNPGGAKIISCISFGNKKPGPPRKCPVTVRPAKNVAN